MNISEYFDNNFDCYSSQIEAEDTPAVSKERFIELIWRLIPNDAQLDGETQKYLSTIDFRDKTIKADKERIAAKKSFEKGFQAAISLLTHNCK